MAREWQYNSGTNYGICLEADNSDPNDAVGFYGPRLGASAVCDCYDCMCPGHCGNESVEPHENCDCPYCVYAALRPALKIQYRVQEGIEDYWTARANSLPRSGTGYVKDFSGNLTWLHESASVSAGVNSFSLGHVYNSSWMRQTIPAHNIAPEPLTGAYGNRWRLSAERELLIGFQVLPDSYTDADGTKHWLRAGGDGKYYDEDGLGLVVGDDTAPGLKYARFPDGSKELFDANGNLVKIIDKNGNETLFCYLAEDMQAGTAKYDARLESITGPGGQKINLQYHHSETGGMLRKIIDNAKRETVFSYDASKNLASITYPDKTVTTFSYTASSMLSSAANSETGKRIGYAWSEEQVTGISGFGAGNTAGAVLNVTRTFLQTTYTVQSTGRSVTYQFSRLGNTVLAFDSDGNAATQGFDGSTGRVVEAADSPCSLRVNCSAIEPHQQTYEMQKARALRVRRFAYCAE